MSSCCGGDENQEKKTEVKEESPCCSSSAPIATDTDCPITYFKNMVPNALKSIATVVASPVLGVNDISYSVVTPALSSVGTISMFFIGPALTGDAFIKLMLSTSVNRRIILVFI